MTAEQLIPDLAAAAIAESVPLETLLMALRYATINRAAEACGGRQNKMAQQLGLTKRQMDFWIKRMRAQGHATGILQRRWFHAKAGE